MNEFFRPTTIYPQHNKGLDAKYFDRLKMTYLIENNHVVDCISLKAFIFSRFTPGCLESIQSEATLANGTTDSSSFAFGSAAAAARQRYGLRAFSSPHRQSSPNIVHHLEARARDLPPIRPIIRPEPAPRRFASRCHRPCPYQGSR